MSDTARGPVFLRRSDLKNYGIVLSNTQLLRLESGEKFPRRVRLSAGTVAWVADEIEQWIERKKEERKNHHYAPVD